MEPLDALSREELIATVLQLRGIIAEQAQALKLAQQRIETLEKEVTRLKGGGKGKSPPAPPPDWVKPNTRPNTGEQEEKKPRKKRMHNPTWKRLPPTREQEYACEHCPDCGRKLDGGWEYSRHQVVEIPPISPEVVDHVVIARRCGACGKNCTPQPDLSEQTVGQTHFGPRLVSFIAHLRTVARLPMRQIQQLLLALWGLSMSVGQISELLHRVAQQGRDVYEGLRDEMCGSAYVHADETGWRENGQNGYLWSFSTPCVRYFVYEHSRAHEVPERVLGSAFRGVLISDFYSGYHYYAGPHQRCWVHLLRDVHELKEKYPTEGVLAWAKKLRDLYDRAKAFSSACPKARRVARLEFQAELLELAGPYRGVGLPQSQLAERLVRFEAELFTFVEHPEVPSENNAAERSVRPRVIARKISGGTRSPAGSAMMAVLASLFETWRLRGENALEACRQMLIASQRRVAPASANSL